MEGIILLRPDLSQVLSHCERKLPIT